MLENHVGFILKWFVSALFLWFFCRLREDPCFFPSDNFLISWAGKITGKFSSNLVFSVWSIVKNQSLKIFQGKAQIIKWTLENIIFHCNWIIHINAYKRIKDKWNKGIWNEKKESLKWDSKNSLSSAFWIFLFVKKELVSISTFWYSGSNITTFSSDDLLEIFFFFCNLMKYLKYTNCCWNSVIFFDSWFQTLFYLDDPYLPWGLLLLNCLGSSKISKP